MPQRGVGGRAGRGRNRIGHGYQGAGADSNKVLNFILRCSLMLYTLSVGVVTTRRVKMNKLDDWEAQALAAYVADYIVEEQARGNVEIDKYIVRDAIDAYFGGAAETAAQLQGE